ncbi:MAG TPA: VanZ family protein [Melioribacteraceae bacterium]|nr:VanZ family protein [Melioribacteraceae bacterium]
MQLNSLLIHLYSKIKTNPFYFIHLPLFVYWLFLLTVTSIPIAIRPKLFNAQDKFEHFTAYFILAFLLRLSFQFQKKFRLKTGSVQLITSVIVLLYAAFDELHQLLIPGRYCDLYDWLFDIGGGFAGLLLSSFMIKKIDGSA